MADMKISDLTAATSASGAMQLEVNDSAVSKSVTVDQIKAYVLPAGAITATEIATDAVGSAEIIAGAVGTTELADASVTTLKIVDANVTTAKIADGSVTGAKLEVSGVTAGTYGSASVIPSVTVDSKGRITGVSGNTVVTGGMTLITSGSLPAATSLTLSSIPQTYQDLVLVLKHASGTSGTTLIQPNSDATAGNYFGSTITGATLAALAVASIALDISGTSSKDHICTIKKYADTAMFKTAISSSSHGTAISTYFTNCVWQVLTAITSLKVTRSAAWTGGTYELWGVN